MDGFNRYDLNKKDTINQRVSAPLITKLLLFGEEIKAGEPYQGDVILEQSVSTTRHIHLKHFQNFVSFEFSALNYVNPSQTYYKYMLEGEDVSWNVIRSDKGIGRANYTGFSHGLGRKQTANTRMLNTLLYARLQDYCKH